VVVAVVIVVDTLFVEYSWTNGAVVEVFVYVVAVAGTYSVVVVVVVVVAMPVAVVLVVAVGTTVVVASPGKAAHYFDPFHCPSVVADAHSNCRRYQRGAMNNHSRAYDRCDDELQNILPSLNEAGCSRPRNTRGYYMGACARRYNHRCVGASCCGRMLYRRRNNLQPPRRRVDIVWTCFSFYDPALL
jgi:hypothetical protein